MGKVEGKGARGWRVLSGWERRGEGQEQTGHAREQKSREIWGLLLPALRRLRTQPGGQQQRLRAVHVAAAKHSQKRKRLTVPLTGITHLPLLQVKQSCLTCWLRKLFILPVHNAGLKTKSFLLLTQWKARVTNQDQMQHTNISHSLRWRNVNLNLENWLYKKEVWITLYFPSVVGIQRHAVVHREVFEKCPIIISVGLQGAWRNVG